jgi:hypothetical protein
LVIPSWSRRVVQKFELDDRVIYPRPIQGLCQGLPHLKKEHHFKDNISGVFHKFRLNGHLVSKEPQRPRLGNKKKPNTSSKSTRETRDDSEQLRKVSGAPAAPQQLAGHAPSKDSSRAGEEDMRGILRPTTQFATAVARPMTGQDVETRG